MKKFLQFMLSTHLKYLGYFICKHPVCFVILPCITSALLGTGMLMIKYERDLKNLVKYEEGQAFQSQKLEETLFPVNTSKFVDILRIVDYSLIPMFTAISRNGQNILNKEYLKEIEILDRMIKNVSITFNERIISYNQLCGKTDGNCFENPIISVLPNKELISTRRRRLEYPIFLDPLTYNYRCYAVNVGGVTVENGFVDEANALRLFYLTDTSNKTKTDIIKKWINAAVNKLKITTFSHITVLPFEFSLLTDEIKDIALSLLPLTAAVVAAIGIFSFFTSMTSSWITSKPWLGVAACISAGLALISSFGLAFHFGVPTTDFNIGIPFLILGTEVDDAYVLIATWRKTNASESVSKRMEDTFAEAGVSITITSITNVISFCVGIMTPFFGVKCFCIHAAIALAFTYFYMLTFFGGCMAIDGFREKKLLHAITFQKCPSYKQENHNKKDETAKEIVTMKVFKEVIGKYLEKPCIKILVIICFISNFSVGFYGLSQLENGLRLTNLLAPNSVSAESINLFYRYFSNFYGILHIVINEPLNYADPKIQQTLDETLQKFWSHPKIGDPSLTLSWLKFYKIFQNNLVAQFSLNGYNLSLEEDFNSGLHNVFLQFPVAKHFKYDIVFNENYTKIMSSRFFMPIIDINNRVEENSLARDMWRIAGESKFKLTVHSPFFPLIEQGVIIRNVVFQLAWVTSLLIFVVFFAFIPSFLTALIVAISVVSILVETVGYMALWGVKLDIISTTILVLSVGFSVNYPGHIACAFSLAKKENPNEKMKEALYHVGMPIVQGSLSTVLGASLLAIKNTYVCTTFPKLMFLIALQTAFHALFVLPVGLSCFTHYTRRCDIIPRLYSKFICLERNGVCKK